ncbi:hypothetical protein FLGSB24_30220 [Flavobacterium sp. GSB-24]|nr:hypothetical protein FLGSB24_30220 [Flavobacterium sp. GSB-24]
MTKKMELNEIMQIANETILQVKRILKFGSGSIIEDILQSDSESLGRSDYARDMYAEENQDDFSELKKITLRAAAAEIAMGGNCHESASLVFSYLMANTKNLKIQLCRERMDDCPSDFHVFTRIILDQSTCIIADEWGSNPTAYISQTNSTSKDIMHEDITDESNALYFECIEILKKGECYLFWQRRERENKDPLVNVYKTCDNLEHLASDKYIGGRGKRAYNDPTP